MQIACTFGPGVKYLAKYSTFATARKAEEGGACGQQHRVLDVIINKVQKWVTSWGLHHLPVSQKNTQRKCAWNYIERVQSTLEFPELSLFIQGELSSVINVNYGKS